MGGKRERAGLAKDFSPVAIEAPGKTTPLPAAVRKRGKQARYITVAMAQTKPEKLIRLASKIWHSFIGPKLG